MKQARFPPGWNQERVESVLQHYEQQSEEQAVTEDDELFKLPEQTVMEVPTSLVAAVRELIARHNQQGG
jgi:hypothetical protein